jgi:hypothetical protein
MAKPLANGFPIGAIMVRDHVAEKITVGAFSPFTSWFNTSLSNLQVPTEPPLADNHSPHESAHTSSRVSRNLPSSPG